MAGGGKRGRLWLFVAAVAAAVTCAIGLAVWTSFRWRAPPPVPPGVAEQSYGALFPPGVPSAWTNDPLATIPLAMMASVAVGGYFRLADVSFDMRDAAADSSGLRRLLARLKSGARLHPDDAVALAHAYVLHEQRRGATAPLSQVERIAMAAEERACVVGDVHGEFSAVPVVLERCGVLSDAPRHIIFNGDLVDRGSNSMGVLVGVLGAHRVHPTRVHLGRGNHEDAAVCRSYGFMDEVARHYGRDHAPRVYAAMLAVFAYMPAIHVLAGRTAVLHGGLPTRRGGPLRLDTPMPRPTPSLAVASDSALSEVLWNDPDGSGTHSSRLDAEITGRRRFGAAQTSAFLAANGLALVVRSHEAVRAGIAVHHDGRVVTVFSAPGYGQGYVGDAAFVTVDAAGGYERETLSRHDCAAAFV